MHPPPSGESKLDEQRRVQFLTQGDDTSRWSCKRSRHLRDARVRKWSKHARHHKSWGAALRWVREFANFARAMCSANAVPHDAVKMRADDELCSLFLTEVAEQHKGVSRVVAARRALSRQRIREKGSSLNGVEDITLLVEGVRRSQPKTRFQVESLDVNDVAAMAAALSASTRWQDRQLGVLIAAGFLTILRYGELQRVYRRGVRVVFKSGREVPLSELRSLESIDLDQVQGVLIHIPWRKSKQDADAWIPLSCRSTIRLLLNHERSLRSLGHVSNYLFPSVLRTRGNPPHPKNFFGSTQFRNGLRKALRDFCGMSVPESKVYGGHSLRVGGSNFMRRLGIDPDIHRSLGGWSVLKSARDYMQLTPTEQFSLTRNLAVQQTRHQAIEDASRARSVIPRLRRLAIG